MTNMHKLSLIASLCLAAFVSSNLLAATPKTVSTHFVGGTPEGLSTFKVKGAVTKVTTFNWRSKNLNLNVKPKLHTLSTRLSISDDLTINYMRMKNFYSYDAKAHLLTYLSKV